MLDCLDQQAELWPQLTGAANLETYIGNIFPEHTTAAGPETSLAEPFLTPTQDHK